jgi:hypothetical protein
MGLKDLLTNPPQNFKYYVGGQGYTGNGSTPNMLNLRYGNDTLGGGNSNQPYIQTSIPTGFSGLQNSTNDFILRGGMLAAKDSVTDVRRLGKMFTDTKSPNGLLFIAKQNLLSRVAVRTQASTGLLNEGIYTPLSTLAQAGLVAFGGHLNKQGLNPFAGAGSNGYFRGSYLQAIKPQLLEELSEGNPNFKNRLIQLFGIKEVNPTQLEIPTFFRIGNTNNISNNDINVLSYPGGPGSILGVGKTNIKFASSNLGGPLRTLYNPVGKNPLNNYGNANFLVTGYDGFSISVSSPSTPLEGRQVGTTTRTSALGAQQITATGGEQIVTARKTSKESDFYSNGTRNNPSYSAKIGDFRASLRGLLNGKSTIMSNSPDYKNENFEIRTNIGGTATKQGPGFKSSLKNLISYTSGSRIGPIDRINALPIYRSDAVDTSQPVNDLVKFRIAAIDTQNPTLKNFIHFRAFLDSFSDTYNADWGTVNYLGRGEDFYTYKGFSRGIAMGWTVAAQSKEEIMIMYKKLNYLASTLAPSYTSKGYMAGNLVQLTVGGYLYEQVGFISGLTYDVPMESPWEIGINDEGDSDSSVKEVPHIIKVTGFNFIPIQSFIPSKQNLYGFSSGDKGIATVYGDQRFISLANGGGFDDNNYDSDYVEAPLPPIKRTGFNTKNSFKTS